MKKSIIVCAILMFSASGHAECPSADLSSDCSVGLADLAVMANEWTGQGGIPLLYDIADQWLAEGVPNDPENLVWVYIDDPGVDEDGDGIADFEGFTGEMSRYKTTNAQYCAYLNSALADGSITVYNNKVYASFDTGHFQVYSKTWPNDSDSQITYDAATGTFAVRSRDDLNMAQHSMADHPVVRVSWYGATAFCNYYGYRLPTEWQWQAVADHYGEFTYGCGTTIDPTTANYYGPDGFVNPLDLSDYPYTSPVDHYPAYGYGMNDMAGNVWEWTDSIYSGSDLVICGGSWANSEDYCTVWSSLGDRPTRTASDIGFRVCR